MKNQISKAEEFLDVESCAWLLRRLFDRKKLWENRQARKLPYRNGNWFTLGASMYLDLHDEKTFPAYALKVDYFNRVLRQNFRAWEEGFLKRFQAISTAPPEIKMLADVYEYAALPGFHIFPPEETLQVFFGKVHCDHQWKAFEKMPKFPFAMGDIAATHFSFTLPLALPYQGGGMAIPTEHDPSKTPVFEPYMYEEGNLYVHSGQFPHYVLPYRSPVTPLDWRITYQGHGFLHQNTAYLYW